MSSTKGRKLRAKLVEKDIGIPWLAKELGMNSSTFYRKLRRGIGAFTVSEMQGIVHRAALTDEEALDIFLRDEQTSEVNEP